MSFPNNYDIILAPQAAQDIQDILHYTQEQWGETQKDAYKVTLTKGVQALANMPYIGKVRQGTSSDYRVWLIGSHIAIYRVEGNDVVILRLIHQRMDIDGV